MGLWAQKLSQKECYKALLLMMIDGVIKRYFGLIISILAIFFLSSGKSLPQ